MSMSCSPAGTDIELVRRGRRPDDRAVHHPDRRRQGHDRRSSTCRRHETPLDIDPALDLDVGRCSWRPNHDQFVVTAKSGDNGTFWVVNHADGSGKRARSRSRRTRSTSRPCRRRHEARLRDLGAGTVRRAGSASSTSTRAAIATLTPERSTTATIWQSPWFSPDGTRLLLDRFLQGHDHARRSRSSPPTAAAPRPSIGPTSRTTRRRMPSAHPTARRSSPRTTTPRTTWTFDADGTNGHGRRSRRSAGRAGSAGPLTDDPGAQRGRPTRRRSPRPPRSRRPGRRRRRRAAPCPWASTAPCGPGPRDSRARAGSPRRVRIMSGLPQM